MINSQHNKLAASNISPAQHEIVDKLAYFGVFKHPLKQDELQNLLVNYYKQERIAISLRSLVENGVCYEYKGYYSVHEDLIDHVNRRLQNEDNATYFFSKLPFFARIMSTFPYVRGVAVSGSLSKGLMHPDGDIDYFIITAQNRLWFTRMLLVMFKKIFLLNSHRFFCVNYFVSENHLEIPDKNMFTATEISTLLPVYGKSILSEFKKANSWLHRYYGHFEHPIEINHVNTKYNRLKRVIEWAFNNPLGNFLDIMFMYITIWRWDVKFKHFNRSKFSLTMRSNRNVSKHHPRDFQTVVLTKMDEIKSSTLNKIKVK